MEHGWRTTAEVNDALMQLDREHDQLCQVISLAESPVDHSPIMALIVGRLDRADDAIPVLITGGVHAREWATSDALVDFATNLVTHRASGEDLIYGGFTTKGVRYCDPPYVIESVRLATIFENFQIVILPVVNPDGRDFSLRATTFGDQIWRKNRRDLRVPCDNLGPQCVGVDINRNYDIAWDPTVFYREDAAKFDDVSDSKCDFQNYKGDGPGSEVETQTVMQAAADYQVQAYVDVHMTGRTISYPWAFERIGTNPAQRWDEAGFNRIPHIAGSGRDGKLGDSYGEFMPPDLHRRLQACGQAMADEIITSAGRSPVARLRSTYRVLQTIDLVDGTEPFTTFTGNSDDYVFSLQFAEGADHDCLAYTMEIGMHPGDRPDNPLDHENGFFPDVYQDYPKIRREAHAGLFGLLSHLTADR